MGKRGILDAAQKTVVKAAKVGAEGAKDVATDALGAAASAAAGVVLGRVSEALGSGQKEWMKLYPRKDRRSRRLQRARDRSRLRKGFQQRKARRQDSSGCPQGASNKITQEARGKAEAIGCKPLDVLLNMANESGTSVGILHSGPTLLRGREPDQSSGVFTICRT
jgi:hypothetical protein